jgi:hypothetical protein
MSGGPAGFMRRLSIPILRAVSGDHIIDQDVTAIPVLHKDTVRRGVNHLAQEGLPFLQGPGILLLQGNVPKENHKSPPGFRHVGAAHLHVDQGAVLAAMSGLEAGMPLAGIHSG